MDDFIISTYILQYNYSFLRIYNVQPDDRGRYICTASSSAGSARDYTFLDIRSKFLTPFNVKILTETYLQLLD